MACRLDLGKQFATYRGRLASIDNINTINSDSRKYCTGLIAPIVAREPFFESTDLSAFNHHHQCLAHRSSFDLLQLVDKHSLLKGWSPV